MSEDHRQLLRAMFDAAVGAAHPSVCLPAYLEKIAPPKGRTIVVGAGKAAASMAAAVEKHWPHPLEGLVVTRYEHGAPTSKIEVIEASHPVPDAAGRAAAGRILAKVQGLTEDDLVLALISGGGSALMALPADGVSLEEKQAVNKALLKSGATISEMNCVRKHLSAIKGGRLARAAAPAKVVALLISDVPNDDLSVIASGPTVPDPTTRQDALAVIAKYKIDAPAAVLAYLSSDACETPKPGDAIFDRVENILIATPQGSLDAAAAVASKAGFTPLILGDLEGESRDVALVHAGITRQIARHAQPLAPPVAIISGGETTVTVRGKGRGGRDAEFLLALTLALEGFGGVSAIACDTDGIDGSEDNAGAIMTADSFARAAAQGVDLKALFANNDAYTAFEKLGDLVVTGPTRTNVNDFRVILVPKPAR
ncbi:MULTISPECIES: glycerate kinase type-2 family protein [Methylosinus]|uniref:Glycerate kinase n=1 Tax=Methylosinus trichosporium (strain ATCC 35070 / NCIMB 11131 / UNIQEM 75 / OB3b) TaxID=595536 RepID=A0A2D2D0P0_METT3|nr:MULTISPECIES: glycerate kinase [Methylosinus]ATQ68565.1 glycerate kinase [Methylosinus trichosporium OB3b]OBS52781.1 hydroxypyruvate reductase [Methylosinus sp. 3S-1]